MLRLNRRGRRSHIVGAGVSVLAVLLSAACTTASEPVPEPVRRSPTRLPTTPPADPPPSPPVPCPKARAWTGTTTEFGTNVSTRQKPIAEAMVELDRLFGRLEVVRVFDPSVPPQDAWSRRREALANRVVVTSFRMPPAAVITGQYDSQIRSFFRSTPANVTLFWSYYHEVEPHIDAGKFTADQYRRAFRRLVDIAQRLCKPNLYPTLILTGYTAEAASGRDWRVYYPGDSYISVLGWDPYNQASGQPTVYGSPPELYDHVIEASDAAGKPFAIAETGSRLIPGDDTGAQRARWLHDVGAYLDERGAVFVTYYHSIGISGADYRLLDRPSVRAWRFWVTRK